VRLASTSAGGFCGERTRPRVLSATPPSLTRRRTGRAGAFDVSPAAPAACGRVTLTKARFTKVGRDAALRRPDGPAGRPYLVDLRFFLDAFKEGDLKQ